MNFFPRGRICHKPQGLHGYRAASQVWCGMGGQGVGVGSQVLITEGTHFLKVSVEVRQAISIMFS